jgi:hypothetical protein
MGLSLGGKTKVRHVDGQRARRRVAKGVYVQLQGRDSMFSAIIEPKREAGLIGAIVPEDLDLVGDCEGSRVVPRAPRGAIYEIE